MNYKPRVRPGIALVALLLLGGVKSVFGASVLGAGDIITLSNGFNYRFAGMTYGTNHVHGPLGARIVHGLPVSARNFLEKEFGSHLGTLQSYSSIEPSLCIWFDPATSGSGVTNSPRLEFIAMLADEKGVLAGTTDADAASANQPFAVMFWLVPRRASTLEVVFFRESPGNLVGSEICRVRLPNRLYGQFPHWQPDTTPPAVKVAGDVEVHLDDFRRTGFDASFKSVGQAKGKWEMLRAELSDATGNHIYLDEQVLQFNQPHFFEGALWPDEGAWKLTLEVKHSVPFAWTVSGPLPTNFIPQTFVPEEYGFTPGEVLTFSNVPVLAAGTTNTLQFTNSTGESRIVMQEFLQEPRGGGSGLSTYGQPKFHAESANASDGISVDFLEARSAQGDRLGTIRKLMFTVGGPTPRARDYLFTAVATSNLSTVNVTWLVQKTRKAEFLIKPPSR